MRGVEKDTTPNFFFIQYVKIDTFIIVLQFLYS